MGLNATMFVVTKEDFSLLKENPDMNLLSGVSVFKQVFKQNFEAIRYILKKTVSEENKSIIDEIFYPKQYIGHLIEFEAINYTELDSLKTEEWPIVYLPPSKITRIRNLMTSIDEETFLDNYNGEELNNHGVYPYIWQDAGSVENEFNRSLIKKGYIELIKLFEFASLGNKYILVVVGA